MADYVKQMEDEYVKEAKDGMRKVGAEMTHETELVMRTAFNRAAVLFRELGRHEGDEGRKNKIVRALGLVIEEPVS